MDEESLRGAAVRVAIIIKPGFTLQRVRLDANAFVHSLCEAPGQLADPVLYDRGPGSIGVAEEKLLPASAGAVEAPHRTEQDRTFMS